MPPKLQTASRKGRPHLGAKDDEMENRSIYEQSDEDYYPPKTPKKKRKTHLNTSSLMAGPSSSRRPTRHPRFNSDDVQDPETEYEDTSRDANIENEDGDFGGDDNEEDASQDGNEYERGPLRFIRPRKRAGEKTGFYQAALGQANNAKALFSPQSKKRSRKGKGKEKEAPDKMKPHPGWKPPEIVGDQSFILDPKEQSTETRARPSVPLPNTFMDSRTSMVQLASLTVSGETYSISHGIGTCSHGYSHSHHEDELVDACCCVASYLECYYNYRTRSLVCFTIKALFPLSLLPLFVERHLPHVYRKITKEKLSWESIVGHLSVHFNIPPDQTMESIIETIGGVRFPVQIPGLEPPGYSTRCPECQHILFCNKKRSITSAAKDAVTNHWSSLHRTIPYWDPVLPIESATNPFPFLGNDTRYCLFYADDYIPLPSDVELENIRPFFSMKTIPRELMDSTYQNPYWFPGRSFRVLQNLQFLADHPESEIARQNVLSLLAPVSIKRLNAESQMLDDRLDILLHHCADISLRMLKGACVVLDRHRGLRRVALSKAGRLKLRTLRQKTWSSYRRALFNLVAIPLRYLAIKYSNSRNSPSKQIDLGVFAPQLSDEQWAFIMAIFDHIDPKHPSIPDADTLAPHFLNFLVSVVTWLPGITEGHPDEEETPSYMDQVTALSMLDMRGFLKDPSTFSALMVRHVRIIFSTIINLAVARSRDTPWAPISAEKLSKALNERSLKSANEEVAVPEDKTSTSSSKSEKRPRTSRHSREDSDHGDKSEGEQSSSESEDEPEDEDDFRAEREYREKEEGTDTSASADADSSPWLIKELTRSRQETLAQEEQTHTSHHEQRRAYMRVEMTAGTFAAFMQTQVPAAPLTVPVVVKASRHADQTAIEREVIRNRQYLTTPLNVEGDATGTTELVNTYSNWWDAHKASLNHVGKVDIEWSDNDTVIMLTWGHISQMRIEIAEWSRLVRSHLTSLWPRICKELIPSSESGFNVDALEDDVFSNIGVFDRPANARRLRPHREHLLSTLGLELQDDGSVVGDITSQKATEFLAKVEKLRRHYLTACIHSCGCPARAFQIALMLFNQVAGDTKGRHRNLRLIHGIWVWGNFVAKQDDSVEYPSYLRLPPQASLPTVYLFGVVRYVELVILKKFKIPTHEFAHFMFVKASDLTIKRKRFTLKLVYTERRVNACLREAPGLGVEIRVIRQLISAVIQKFYPHLIIEKRGRIISPSPLARQSQHEDLTGALHYANDKRGVRSGFYEAEYYAQCPVSNSIHAFHEIIPRDSVHGDSLGLGVQANLVHAIHVARTCVRDSYALSSLKDPSDCKQRVLDLQRSTPYINGSEVSAPFKIVGDHSLASVTATLVNGLRTEIAGPVMHLLEQYTPVHVAQSAMLIHTALEEWKNGEFAELDWSLHMRSEGYIEALKAIGAIFEATRAGSVTVWRSFCYEVHKEASSQRVEASDPSSEYQAFNEAMWDLADKIADTQAGSADVDDDAVEILFDASKHTEAGRKKTVAEGKESKKTPARKRMIQDHGTKSRKRQKRKEDTDESAHEESILTTSDDDEIRHLIKSARRTKPQKNQEDSKDEGESHESEKEGRGRGDFFSATTETTSGRPARARKPSRRAQGLKY